jgi:hypothetical protein
MAKRKEQKRQDKSKGKTKRRPGGRKMPQVPPPDSSVWPEQYRGKRWKRAYAFLFAGRCQLCAYSCPLPESRQLLDKVHGQTRLLLCTNHPASPGELREVLPLDTCRNFKPQPWKPKRRKANLVATSPPFDESDPSVRRIPVGRGLFAIIDACDYAEISKYRWYANRRGHNVYAVCRKNGKTIYMHRMIMRPRRDCVVDHIDGNGLNNRRSNLRVCTRRQNQANKGPRGGSSRFVGVYRQRDKWLAGLRCRGRYFHAGLFDDEVEAAKARDRKAYELHGEYAYLNFPEDFDR